MTPEEINLIIELWNDGKSASVIAKLLPYKEHRVIKEIVKLKQNGVLKGNSGRTKQKALGKILQAYNSGITNPHDIAEMFGLKVGTVNTILGNSKLDRKRPTHNYVKRELDEKTIEILQEIENGVSLSEIARKYNCSRQWVSKIKKKYYEREQNNEIQV